MQAEHTHLVKALYDYEAAAPGELTINEDDVLLAFELEDDWLLVQSQKEDGGAGYVPGNYVEETTGDEPAPTPRVTVPPSVCFHSFGSLPLHQSFAESSTRQHLC